MILGRWIQPADRFDGIDGTPIDFFASFKRLRFTGSVSIGSGEIGQLN